MKKTILWKFTCLALVLSRAVMADTLPSVEVEKTTLFLEQGWSAAIRDEVSFMSFGSRFIPYTWFLALEQAGSTEAFRANAHLATLGFITTAANAFNPDGLPVGIAKDTAANGDTWAGLTCAACHTGQVSIHGKRVRIDGGQALLNFTAFEEATLAALKETLADPEKFSRFAQKISVSDKHFIDATNLRARLQTRIQELTAHYAVNHTDVAYGHGRLDAFGQIFNAIAVEALQLPENKHSPNAPTSFPVLWDASHLNVVQWNASAQNKEPGPLFQNAITALAVYGTVTVPKDTLTYTSSIKISNLGDIQKNYYKLVAPVWPQELAGKLDPQKIATGAALYNQHCVQCHTLVNSADKKRKLRAVLTPVIEVGTDPLMANNFTQFKVKTGVLEGEKAMVFIGDKLPAEASPLDLVVHVAAGSLFNQPWQTIKALFKEYAANDDQPVQAAFINYKARPINGIWASAPYLHNGSVPTIYDLLLPAAQRPHTFYVGSIELDTQKVGYQSTQASNASLFDTKLTGNSNAGHEFGTQLNDAERWALVEYIKSL